MSRMDVLSDEEINLLVDKSELVTKYNEVIDRESAYEILNKKIEEVHQEEEKQKEETKAAEKAPATKSTKRTTQNPLVKMVTSATFMRGVLGILKKIIK